MKKITIAIDGFSSCGKSTMAKDLAREIGYIYIDSGAMYRAVTLYSIENGIFQGNDIDTERLRKEIDNIHISFQLNPETGRPDTYLNGVNVENKIRSMEVSSHVSPIATLGFVREAMVAQQQAMGNSKGIVMDGRDIGTTVFPDAELKIFVTATPEIRAQRRYDELKAKGQEASFDEILENVKQRDYIDQNREVSPLRKADDALLLDNTDMTIPQQKEWLQEQFNKIVKKIKEKGCSPSEGLFTISISTYYIMVKVEIDEGSGFCFGVVTAINKAEEELANGGTLYCLGDIVHNSREVERLKEMGLITINHDDFNHLHDAKVLLRAHGEPPETYEIARRNNIEIIDATCPVVLRLQKKIKQEYTQKDTEDKQIVIYGKTGHAEVLGLVGQTTGEAIVIEKLEEAKKLDFTRSIRLYSQTTKSLDEFQKIVEYIKEHISPDVTFEYYDTICRQVANRIPNIRKFAASHDLVFFVSGKKSSNGKMLFSECKKVNPNSHLIDSAEEIDSSLLTGASSIGVCGATSTPKWLMEEISKAIQSRLTGQ